MYIQLGEVNMNCKYNGCERPTTGRLSELCHTHYQKEWRSRDIEAFRKQRREYYARNSQKVLAASKKWREKNPDLVRKNARNYMAKFAKLPITQDDITDSVKERFFAKVEKTDSCWNWTSARTASRPKRVLADATEGYGVISINKRPFYAHRASWLMHNGPLTPGLVIDHLCENTLCVNPEHLRETTSLENSTRSPKHSKYVKYAYYKTHCKYGHVRTEQMRGKVCSECYQSKRKNKTKTR